MERFRGKTAVVTGASGGIGNAIALALSGRGVHLHLVGRNRKSLDLLAKDLSEKFGNSVVVHEANFHQCDELPAILEKLSSEDIDFLVHAAGQIIIAPVERTTIHDQDELLAVNFRVPCEITRLLLPAIRRTGGAIVFINSSTSQQSGKAGLSAYAASKSALKAFSECLRDEENANGVRVVNIYPGRTASAMQELVHQSEGRAYSAGKLLQSADVAEVVVHALGQPETAEVTDISIRPFRKN